MTEPTEAAEAHRLITEAFADYEADMQAEVSRALGVVHRAATDYAAGDMDLAGALLVTYIEHNETPDESAYMLALTAVSGLGFVLDGDLIEPPCQSGGKHGDVVDTAVHAGNLASARDTDRLSRTLGAVRDQNRDALLPLVVTLVVLLAGVLAADSDGGDRDA